MNISTRAEWVQAGFAECCILLALIKVSEFKLVIKLFRLCCTQKFRVLCMEKLVACYLYDSVTLRDSSAKLEVGLDFLATLSLGVR